MALIVEDGTGVVDANSYVTTAELRAYAALRGATLPAADPDLEPLAVRAFDFIETYAERFLGTPTYPGKSSWPRSSTDEDGVVTGVTINGAVLLTTDIPSQLKKVQSQLAIDLQTNDPLAASDGRVTTMEKVGSIEVAYAAQPGQRDQAILPLVDALMRPLLFTRGPLTSQRI